MKKNSNDLEHLMYFSRQMPPETSIDNRQKLVQILNNSLHIEFNNSKGERILGASGIFLTDDGWFITAGHFANKALSETSEDYRVISNNSSYELDKSSALIVEGIDIALMKARKEGQKVPIPYGTNFNYTQDSKVMLRVVDVKNNAQSAFIEGTVSSPSIDHLSEGLVYRDGFEFNLSNPQLVHQGHSGSPIFSYQGELMGVFVAKPYYDEETFYASKLSNLANFISRFVEDYKRFHTNKQDL